MNQIIKIQTKSRSKRCGVNVYETTHRRYKLLINGLVKNNPLKICNTRVTVYYKNSEFSALPLLHIGRKTDTYVTI